MYLCTHKVSFFFLLYCRQINMSGDAELNVDSLIARLLEGKLMKKKKIDL
jgi:hypothetical protein